MRYFMKGNEVKRLYALMLAVRMTGFEVVLRYKRTLLFILLASSSLVFYLLYSGILHIPKGKGFTLPKRAPKNEDEALVSVFKKIL